MTTAIEAIREHGEALAPEARERWGEQQLVAIWNTVADGLSLGEFAMFTSLAAKYDLDPFAKEIYAAKGRSKDGGPGRLLLLVGRDGLLKVARRSPDFGGFDGDVHRAKDTFRVSRTADGQRTVEHSYEGDAEARGPIVGSWAIVYRKGMPPTYVYAPLAEYAPQGDKYSPWSKQTSAMIAKCSLSLALRLAYGISGVVGEDEVARSFEDAAPGASAAWEEALSAAPGDLRGLIETTCQDAASLRPWQLTPAAVDLSLRGQPREAVEAWLERQQAENARALAEHTGHTGAGAGDDGPVLDGGLSAQAGEEGPAASADTEALRSRLSKLLDARAGVEESPGGLGETEARLAELDAEIDQVEAELARAGAHVPGQEALDVGGRA